jgi:hypothetical protein
MMAFFFWNAILPNGVPGFAPRVFGSENRDYVDFHQGVFR